MSILRSGQPMTGPNNKRCKEDSELVNAVLGKVINGIKLVDLDIGWICHSKAII